MGAHVGSQWPVSGHDWAVDLLQKSLVNGRGGHAYLITGPAQVGRMTLARVLAQALNCESDSLNQRPCGVCRACRLIAAGRHPDVRQVEPEITARGQWVIRIDQIRELQRDLNLAPVEGRNKIALIRDFETANLNAANAFLKTLEEPPRRAILILTASDAEALLPTISSRCRTVSLRPVATPLIAQMLIDRFGRLPAEASRLAHLAGGRYGWAVRAAEEPVLVENHAAHLAALRRGLATRRVGRFALADNLARQPDHLLDVLAVWSSLWRDALLTAISDGSPPSLTNLDDREMIQHLAGTCEPGTLRAALRHTENARWQLEHNGNIRLVLENLLLRYPFPTGDDGDGPT